MSVLSYSIEKVVESLKEKSLSEKINYFEKELSFSCDDFSNEERYVFYCLSFIKQLSLLEHFSDSKKILNELYIVDAFYEPIGGILGYYLEILKAKNESKSHEIKRSYLPPQTSDFRKLNKEVYRYILYAIEHLDQFAEIYPIGGAADRLHLVDEQTKKPLPAAKLPFLGKGLLSLLIEDVQAREYLHFKLYNKQVQTPVCMMTSIEKDNHKHVQKILGENNNFFRDPHSFYLLCQPLCPTIDKDGNFCVESFNHLKKKPGGHGVLWKMLLDKNLFPILKTQGRNKALVRQIDNPIAGADFSLLAFMGYGLYNDKDFGFIGCEPKEGTKEGRNVLVEEITDRGVNYYHSNIEYCQSGLSSIDQSFLANTNILFCDLQAVEKAVIKTPFPGMLVNYKEGKCLSGIKKTARLEATMQNISDSFSVYSEEKDQSPNLTSFVTQCDRKYTLSPAKKVYQTSGSLIETPENAFIDILKNNKTLLDTCGVKTPDVIHGNSINPNFIFLYHQALGPLFSIISKKIKGGEIANGSEVQLELAEVFIENLSVNGSFLLLSNQPLGHVVDNRLIYSDRGPKAYLKNVTIDNQGIDKDKVKDYWRCEYQRKEEVTIVLEENSEIFAEDITIKGSFHLVVEKNTKATLRQTGSHIEVIKEKIDSPTWKWAYFIENNEIKIEKRTL